MFYNRYYKGTKFEKRKYLFAEIIYEDNWVEGN